MSATRDKSQKIAFVYSNLYQLYKKGKDAATEAEVPQTSLRGLDSGRVLKAEDLSAPLAVRAPFAPQVNEYRPAELLAKRIVAKPEALRAVAPAPSHTQALSSLKENLQTLNDLHARLRFMLKELEDLVKE